MTTYKQLLLTINGQEEILRRKEAWNQFQNWQAAITMNSIFGADYVEVPSIPEGYETYAQNWLASQV